MVFQERKYQEDSITLSVNYLLSDSIENELLILPTGSGKSVVIARILDPLPGKAVILQPSKEILEQNHAKFSNYGKASIYSASAGQKVIDRITFCTIGSIIKKLHMFKGTDYFIIDEAHCVNPEDGMYRDLVKYFPKAKFLGLTATPYRLTQTEDGSQLNFITRSNPRFSTTFFITFKIQFYLMPDFWLH